MNGHNLLEGDIDFSDIINKEVHWIGLESYFDVENFDKSKKNMLFLCVPMKIKKKIVKLTLGMYFSDTNTT